MAIAGAAAALAAHARHFREAQLFRAPEDIAAREAEFEATESTVVHLAGLSVTPPPLLVAVSLLRHPCQQRF
eukprot:SAG11_NODE_2447_length_3350_cov_1.723162_2_plen_72_part_00